MHLCQSQLVYFCQLRQKLPGGIRFGQFITVPPSSALSREKSAPLREKKMPAADATRATAMRDSFKWDFARGLSFFSLSWYYFLIFKFARDPSFFLLSLYFFVFFARGLSFFSLSALCLGRGGHVVCSSVDPCFSTSGPSSVPPFHFFLIFVNY